MRRVAAKRLEGAPHETLIVIDATTGQNGLRQAHAFAESAEVTGVVLTKLDGTAKGGIALAIASELGIPVKLIGVGEGLEDLRPFDAREFCEALLGRVAAAVSCGSHVRRARRSPPGDPLRRPRPRQADRGRRRQGDARDPPRAARGRRQLQGREAVHGDAQGALPRLGRAVEPRPRPADRQDRQRGAGDADGRLRPRPRVRLVGPHGDPDGGPPGLGQDDGLREAGAAARRAGQERGAGRLRHAAPGGRRAAGDDGQARQRARLRAGRRAQPGRHRRVVARSGEARGARRPDRRHGGPPPRGRGADGRAGRDPQAGEAAQRAAGRRRDDRARTR